MGFRRKKVVDLEPEVEAVVNKIRELEQKIDYSTSSTWNTLEDLLASFGNYYEEKLSSPHNAAIFTAMKCLERIFVTFQDNKSTSKNPLIFCGVQTLKDQLDSEEKVTPANGENNKKKQKTEKPSKQNQHQPSPLWLRLKYVEFVNVLLKLLEHPESAIQIPVLHVLMNLVSKESIIKSNIVLAQRSDESDSSDNEPWMDNYLFGHVVQHLVYNKNRNSELLDTFGEKFIAEYDDVRYFTFANLKNIVNNKIGDNKQRNEESERELATEVYTFLENMIVPDELTELFVGQLKVNTNPNMDDKEKEEKSKLRERNEANNRRRLELAEKKANNFNAILNGTQGKRKRPQQKKKEEEENSEEEEGEEKKEEKSGGKKRRAVSRTSTLEKVNNLVAHKSIFQECWLAFLKLAMPPKIYKEILVKIHTDIIPYMNKPAMLMDFLTDSYNIGGVTSLLALHGLFILITKHNLDYPDFYKKLYALFEPSIFHVKHRSRFFKLAEVFLRSPYLPAYLIAAFIKRMARLALTAPPHGSVIMLVFIYNLIQKNPSCKDLIHRLPKVAEKPILLIGATAEEEDPSKPLADTNGFEPYLADEPEPSKANALQSSLWEIQTLSTHYAPAVSRLTKIFEGDFTKKSYPLTDFIEESYQTIFDNEVTRHLKADPALEFQKKATLFNENDDFNMWKLGFEKGVNSTEADE